MDNISVIIICFPGAPELSQEALQEEAALEQQIDTKVEGGYFSLKKKKESQSHTTNSISDQPLCNFAEIIQMMRSRNEDPDILYVIKFLAAEELPGLPPGGGLTSKWVSTIYSF